MRGQEGIPLSADLRYFRVIAPHEGSGARSRRDAPLESSPVIAPHEGSGGARIDIDQERKRRVIAPHAVRVNDFETSVSGSLVSNLRAPRGRDWTCLAG